MFVARLARITTALILALNVATTPAQAQDMPMPVDVQFSLFFRIITYVRGFETRTADGLVIGVIYQSRNRASQVAKDEVMRQRPPAGASYHVRFVPIDLDGDTDLEAALRAAELDVLYIAPLRAVRTSMITTLTRARSILTITGVPEYVDLGIAVGIGTSNDRPEILVNLAAARAEGATFNAQLLRLATVQ